jgi:hypothetical protein
MKAAILTLALSGGFFLSVEAASWAQTKQACPDPRHCPDGGARANPKAAAKQPIQKPQQKRPQTQPQTQPTNPNVLPY